MIICIEGSDGTGKATQSKILADRLGRTGGCTLFSFPNYASTAGKMIKRLLVEDEQQVHVTKRIPSNGALVVTEADDDARALILQSLMLTNRLEMGAAMRAARTHGHIICDRFDASALVYGALEGLDSTWLAETNAELPIHPDVYILLDAPVSTSFERRPDRRDRYENDSAFLEKVRIEYLKLFAERQAEYVKAKPDATAMISSTFSPFVTKNGRKLSSWHTVDATGTIEQVAALVWEAAGVQA